MKYFIIAFLVIDTAILYLITIQNKQIMAKQDQANSIIAELNDATNSLAAKIQKLIDGQNAGDPVSQESLDQLQTVADQLKAMGADEQNPIPPEA